LTRIGWPTNSGRCCINTFKPKKPDDIAAQLSSPIVMIPASGF
jgi:hypothetical protein